jgi:hypothetical protein
MEDRLIDVIQKITESMETRTNETMKDVIEQYGPEVTINVLINVATSMLAKGLIMTDPSNRDHLAGVAVRLTQIKVDEGHAAVETLMAIGKAMISRGGAQTCQPMPPKKH